MENAELHKYINALDLYIDYLENKLINIPKRWKISPLVKI